MDNIDGATLWNGTFSNDDAGPAMGPLGQKPIIVPQPFISLISVTPNAGCCGPTVAAKPASWTNYSRLLGQASTGLGITGVAAGAAEYGIPLSRSLSALRAAQFISRSGRLFGPYVGIVALGIDSAKLFVDGEKLHADEVTTIHDSTNIGFDIIGFFGVPGYLLGAGYTIFDLSFGAEKPIAGFVGIPELNTLQGVQQGELNSALQNTPGAGVGLPNY